MSKLDDILDHTIYKEGDGPNGSGGEWEHWKNGKTGTLKEEIKALMLQTFRNGYQAFDYHHGDGTAHENFYNEFKKKVEEL